MFKLTEIYTLTLKLKGTLDSDENNVFCRILREKRPFVNHNHFSLILQGFKRFF